MVRLVVIFVSVLLAVSPALAGDVSERVRFNRDIRPLLTDNCYRCHGPDEKFRKAELRLDDEAAALASRDGVRAIVPGRLEKSELWRRITSEDPDERMPPEEAKKELEPDEIALIKRWIEQGAKWEGHWSFTKPEMPSVPKVGESNADRVLTPIDAFVLTHLEARQAGFSPEATREALIRRLSFDLTGLPPTIQEIDEYLADKSASAYEKVVDRLLQSSHFGERMAVAWLDAARYGDSSVFHADGPRDMWGWRDWVIDAYNENMPFDQFTTEQLAGDLLPNATVLQKAASAFNRNHGTTDEGGVIPEEARVEYVVDRVKTTSTVWLGLSMECGQCHDHKYDPITQKEYYGFFAFFNQTSDPGMQSRGGNQKPLIQLPNLTRLAESAAIEKKSEAIRSEIDAYAQRTDPAFTAWLADVSSKAEKTTSLPADPVLHCSLDERKGTAVKDLAAPKRKAEVKGKANWTSGKVGGALRLDGNTHVEIPDAGDFDRTDRFSYGAWIRFDGKGGGAPITRMDDGNAHRGWDLWLEGRRPGMHFIHRWPDDAIKIVAKTELKPKTWQHVFITHDGSAKASGVKIYIDGKEEKWDIQKDALKGTTRTKVALRIGRRTPSSAFKGQIDDVRIYSRTLGAAEVQALAGSDPLGPILAIAPEKRTKDQNEILRVHYLNTQDATYKKLNGELSKLTAKISELTKPATSVMIMQEMAKPRMTYVLDRGNYASPNKDEVIQPGTPAFLPPMSTDAPRNRLGLARWLVSPEHPLTSRVTVNRLWQMFFGTGLVKTSEDFGSLGDWPSHLDLLDWLATDFSSNGWNVKRLIKQIVMSSTYRQSSRMTPELYRRDPENRLLSRGSRFRLQGEFIRDNALTVGGLLVRKVGGPSVKPYQPPGLWNEVSLGGNVRFVQDHGEKLYRRSMYTYWKRSAPAPSMLIFDVPTREKCVVRRQRTNTPLQALVLLNDVQFVESSRGLAERMIKEGGDTAKERIIHGYRMVTAHRPGRVLDILHETYRVELEAFRADPESAKQLLSVGESKRDEALDAAEHAAMTVVASMILNLDKTVMRG